MFSSDEKTGSRLSKKRKRQLRRLKMIMFAVAGVVFVGGGVMVASSLMNLNIERNANSNIDPNEPLQGMELNSTEPSDEDLPNLTALDQLIRKLNRNHYSGWSFLNANTEIEMADALPDVTRAPQPSSDPNATATTKPTVKPTATLAPVEYKLNPQLGEYMGTVSMPSIGISVRVIEGTSNEYLKKGVGHYSRTGMPGDGTNILFSAHRDTHFDGLGNARPGDKIVVVTPKGKFTYQIERTAIVEQDDQSAFKDPGHEILVLSTCYPFNYVGNAPQRYLVFAPLLSAELV